MLQTLALLDGTHSHLRDGVLDRDYAFWIGSGISLGRAASVRTFILKVLDFLHAQSQVDGTGAHLNALKDILAIARGAGFRSRVDLAVAPSTWPAVNRLLSVLQNKYSTLLDVSVAGERDDYLVWDGIDVAHGYVDSLEPDVEHLALAVLVAEGVVAQAQTANWDPLIEKAEEALSIPGPMRVRVAVRAIDLRGPIPRSRLLKFHGCARCAAADPDVYRDLLVARQSQVERWSVDDEHRLMREHMTTSAVTSRSLFIGLSGQDTNIRTIFADAAQRQGWDATVTVGAAVFAEDQLNSDQIDILKHVYGTTYNPNKQQVDEASRIAAFGKQLLVALVLQVWEAKAGVAVASCHDLSENVKIQMRHGLRHLRDLLAGQALTVNDAAEFRHLLSNWSTQLALFRAGELREAGEYEVLSNSTPSELAADPNLTTAALDFYSAVAGAIGVGEMSGVWSVTSTSSGIELDGGHGRRKLVLLGSDRAVAAAIASGHADLDDEQFVIIVAAAIPESVRSPRPKFGRTGEAKAAVLDRTSLFANATDAAVIVDRIAMEGTLA